MYLLCSSSIDQSLHIFENLNVDESSLNNYLRRQSTYGMSSSENNSLNEQNLNAGLFVDSENPPPSSTFVINNENNDRVKKKVKDLEELLLAKDTAMAALTAELDSIRDIASNPSTLSGGTTTTTEYKQYQEDYHNRVSSNSSCRINTAVCFANRFTF